MQNTTFLILLCLVAVPAASTVLPIVQAGAPVLRTISESYTDKEVISSSTRAFAKDLYETLASSGGVGLAAPQVGVSRRMFVIAVNSSTIHPSPLPQTALANPVLDTSASINLPRVEALEGCLSIPGYRALVPRYSDVTVSFTDPFTGAGRKIRGTGYIAVLLQHEFDHLNGILYTDKMDVTSFCAQDLCPKEAGTKEGTWEMY